MSGSIRNVLGGDGGVGGGGGGGVGMVQTSFMVQFRSSLTINLLTWSRDIMSFTTHVYR